MKYLLPILFFIPIYLIGQERGMVTRPFKNIEKGGNIYAVVVGISDYQDENIPDLKYAHKDAEAFANFLSSEAGGNLDADHLKLLINKEATVAKFAVALDWLWEVVKEDDKAIIYFSGHGDVEKKSLTQPGYLLCWDAPSKVYMAGGAFNIRDMKEVVSTLSILNKAKVLLITDACRAGKLSGSDIGGSQATANNLSQQYANEIKILSCQPDEYSIEGPQWGGGRGAFSYHLLDGLYGLADLNNDQKVSLLEIGRYLEDMVSKEVAPHSQIPMTVGMKGEIIANVIPKLLNQIKLGQQGSQLFASTDSKGIEEDVLSTLDSNIIKIYNHFNKSLENKVFLTPQNACAEYYYSILSHSPELEKLHNTIRRNYAAALQDDAQQVMNQWLKSELSENYTSKKFFSEKIKSYPLYLDRASELLGENHYMFATLQARKHFFKGYILANSDRNPNQTLGEEALFEFNKALEFQPDLPHAYWQMSSLYGYSLLQPDSAIIYAQKAMELHPSWITLYTDISYLLFSKYNRLEDAKPFLEKAIQVDSNSIAALNTEGLFHRKNKDYQKAESNFKKILTIDSTFAKAYINLGILYMEQDKLDQAKEAYLKALSIDSTFTNGYINLGITYTKEKNLIDAEGCFKKAIELDPTFIEAYVNLGVVYKKQNKIIEAINTYTKTIELDSTFADSYYNLGAAYSVLKDYPNSIKNFKKTIELDPSDVYAHFSLGYVYSSANNPIEAEKYYKKTIELDSTIYWAYGNLALIYQDTENWENLRKVLQKTNELNPTKEIIPGMFGNALTHIPGNMDQAKTEINKSIEKNPDSTDPFIYMAQWEINNDNLDQAWENLQKALKLDIEKGKLKKEYLTTQSDFEVLKNDNRWNELLIKISMRK